jgi:hypothetical protein
MAIRTRRNKKLTLNLDGPDGNAWVLLGTCMSVANQLGIDWTPIDKEARSKNYRHLVKTLQKHFGNYVDFETDNPEQFS